MTNEKLQELRAEILGRMSKIDLDEYRFSVSHNYPAQGVAHALILSRMSPVGRKYNSLDEMFGAYGIQKRDNLFYFSPKPFRDEGILVPENFYQGQIPLFNPDWANNMAISKGICARAEFPKGSIHNMPDAQFIETADSFHKIFEELTDHRRKWEDSDFLLINLLAPAREIVKILYEHSISKPLITDRRKRMDKKHIDLDKKIIKYYTSIVSYCLGNSPPDYEAIKLCADSRNALFQRERDYSV